MSDPQEDQIFLSSQEDPADLAINAAVGTLEDLQSLRVVDRPNLSELYIAEVGKKFFIRTLDGREVDSYRTSLLVGKGMNQTINQRGMRSKLIVLALGNPDGSRMLKDTDGSMVQGWPSKVLERIFDHARKFNGLTDDETEDEKGNS